MFKVSPYMFTIRTLLYRRPIHPSELQIASITRYQPVFKYKNPKERETCPVPPPPPPKPPKDDKLLWGTVTILLLTGGFVVFCKESPEARDWLTINAPWFDDFLAILFEENMTHKEFLTNAAEDMKKYVTKFISDDQTKPKQCSLGGEYVEDNGAEVKETKQCEDDKEEICPPTPPPIVITKDICEIERCVKDLGECVIHNLNTARDACRYYNALVEESMVQFSFKHLKQLQEAMEERVELIRVSLDNAKNANAKLDEMSRYLDCGVKAPKEHIENTKDLYKDYIQRAKIARIEFQWENDKSLAMDSQWQRVEDVVTKYTQENEDMYPGLNYKSKNAVLNGDPDILLYNSYRYITELENELKTTTNAMTDRINRAIETVLPQSEKLNKQRAMQIEITLKKKRAELDKEFNKRVDDQNASNERTLKHLLKTQQEKFEENLILRMEKRQKELAGKFDKLVDEQVKAEKKKFAQQLADMAGKLRVVEDNLNSRLKAERETRRSQELWSAGASLLAACKKGDAYVDVNKELKAIEKASYDDKMVKSVLKSIPQSVRDKGVTPESVLKAEYSQMEKLALKVALVEADGAPLPVYVLSWIQGLLLFMRISGIPQSEYEKPPREPPEDMDTFDLLQRARFWLQQGNLSAAVTYVNALSGASRAAANKWYEDARAHLEVRQAAEAVIAHAAAMGLHIQDLSDADSIIKEP